jgi:hypothetical protein
MALHWTFLVAVNACSREREPGKASRRNLLEGQWKASSRHNVLSKPSVDNWKEFDTLPCRESPVPDDALGIAANPSPASIASTYVIYARRCYVHNKPKCKLPVCTCSARADDLYCSEYCGQAFSQGTERDFCQCAHSDCSKLVHTGEIIDAAGLPGSISFAPGWVTIEYSDQQDLRDQLILLMTRVDVEIGTEAHPRLAPSRAPSMKALRSA